MVSKHLSDGWPVPVESREIDALLPTVRQMCYHFLQECQTYRIDIIVVSTFRDVEAQRRAWRAGLSQWPPGWSWHNHRAAFDILPVVFGKPIGDRTPGEIEIWDQVGECGRIAGLEWGGDWTVKREREHFQYTYGRSIQDISKGIGLGETMDGRSTFGNGGWSGFLERWMPSILAPFLKNGRG